jgi:hypothetical protein
VASTPISRPNQQPQAITDVYCPQSRAVDFVRPPSILTSQSGYALPVPSLVSHIGTQIAGKPSASGNHNCGYIAPAKSLFDDMLPSASYKERKTFKITTLILLTIMAVANIAKRIFFRLFIDSKSWKNREWRKAVD